MAVIKFFSPENVAAFEQANVDFGIALAALRELAPKFGVGVEHVPPATGFALQDFVNTLGALNQITASILLRIKQEADCGLH